MNDEGFEEWDADFFGQLIQVEELALSSTQHHPHPHPQQPPPHDDISYSPPRELSQRVRDVNMKCFDQSSVASAPFIVPSHNPKEEEIERLKRELGRVSKQLTLLEQDCLQLRNERDKKEEQLKSVFSQIEAKDAEVECRKSKTLEYGFHTRDHAVISPGFQNANSSNDQGGSRVNSVTPTCKTIGVQTEKSWESTHLFSKKDLSTRQRHQSKLLSVWDSRKEQGSPGNLISKLFVACETDLHVLFGCLSFYSKASTNSPADERSSDVGLQDHKPPAQSVEAANVSHLYSMMTKISTGMVKLEALLEALVDLCRVENDVIVYRSLRVLRIVLNYTFSLEMESHERDNVIVEGSPKNTADTCGPDCAETGSLFSMGADEMSGSGHITHSSRLFNTKSLCKELRNHGSAVSTSCLDWGSVFELTHQIAMRNTAECVRLEAVSVMNMILLRSNAYLDREKFAQVQVFASISHFLSKESGLRVQKQVVYLLYLLLNCPKLMAMFCSCCKEEAERSGAADINTTNASSFPGFSVILEGLADCVACAGTGTQELKLRRSAVTLLAFLASSGTSGFEILLGHRLPKRTNFLVLILQMLITEMDVEVVNSPQPPEIFRERTLLIREALILLNRLVSNPQYSTPVLRVLTNSRDTACLTVDIACRLSCKGKWLWQSDGLTRQIREYEIVDLARVFRKRVFTFLGDGMS